MAGLFSKKKLLEVQESKAAAEEAGTKVSSLEASVSELESALSSAKEEHAAALAAKDAAHSEAMLAKDTAHAAALQAADAIFTSD